ncbi:MAG: efflux RND transporter periplasmic adaptor subunit [Pseudomonadota bacterium]
MIKRLVMVIVLLALMFGGIFGWKHHMAGKDAALKSQPPPPATVASAEVMVESWEPYLAAVGSVVATQNVYITTEVAGQVEKILFESGQSVEAGEVILQLDDSVARAELAGLIAKGELAKLQFDRNAKLVKDNTVSQSEYDRLQAELDIAEATLDSKRAVVAKKSIRAPFSGRLGISDVNLGQYLSPGKRIVSLQALDPVYVDFALPERHFDLVRSGQKVLVNVQAYPDREFEGRITAIEPGIEAGTRTLRARATLDNPEQLLRHGMFTEVRTALPLRKNILTLPRTALTYNPYGESVFLITTENDGSRVERRQIKSGEVRNGRVEIIEGLGAGDNVVAAGHQKLRNGQQVKIDNSVQLDDRTHGG